MNSTAEPDCWYSRDSPLKSICAVCGSSSRATLPIQSIASLRLARVLLGRGEAQKALDALKNVAGEGYASELEQVRGDALLALGRADEARKAYDAALAVMDVASPQRRSLEAKRDDVAAGGAPAAAPVAPEAAPPAAPTPETPAGQG